MNMRRRSIVVSTEGRVWEEDKKETYNNRRLPFQGVDQPENVQKDLARAADSRVVSYSAQIISRHEVAFSSLELTSAVVEASTFDDVGGGRTERIDGGCSGSDANAAPTFVGFLDGVVRPGFRHLERGNESRAERLGEGHKLGSLRCVIV